MVFEIPGEEPETLQTLANQSPDREQHDIEFPEGSVFTVPDYPDHPAHGFTITGISFKVEHAPPVVTEFVVREKDHIYMIMESLFEGRRYKITNDGEIVEGAPWGDL